VDGDCCSAAGVQEESRFGFTQTSDGYILSRDTANECDLSGVNHCDDGLDNDGDGLYDAEDPECATLTETLRQALVGTDPTVRESVRTGSNVVIKHQNADGTDVAPSDFWMLGECDAGTCACPDTLTGYDPLKPGSTHASAADLPRPNDPNLPPLSRPACQVAGRACTTDLDCEPAQYPGKASHAGICGHNLQLKREGIFEGNIVARGNARFGRAYIFARTLGDIGAGFFCDGCVLNPVRNHKNAPFPFPSSSTVSRGGRARVCVSRRGPSRASPTRTATPPATCARRVRKSTSTPTTRTIRTISTTRTSC